MQINWWTKAGCVKILKGNVLILIIGALHFRLEITISSFPLLIYNHITFNASK